MNRHGLIDGVVLDDQHARTVGVERGGFSLRPGASEVRLGLRSPDAVRVRERGHEQLSELLLPHRLGREPGHSGRAGGGDLIARRGEQDQRQAGPTFGPEASSKLQAVHLRHAEIEQREIEARGGRTTGGEDLERLRAARDALCGHPPKP